MKGQTASGTLTKGERTKGRIVVTAADLFNRRGFFNTAVTDVAEAAGLEKGAVYNYFPTKDALALAAFAHNVASVSEKVFGTADASGNASEQLLAMLRPYREGTLRVLDKGGCPLLNTAIESTDNHAALRDKARKAFSEWVSRVEAIVRRGVTDGAFRRDIDPAAAATMFVATLEGGVMLARLHRDERKLEAVLSQLEAYVNFLSAATK
jgi:AcrR family transcriptional regulator